jgi:hypothetical protein
MKRFLPIRHFVITDGSVYRTGKGYEPQPTVRARVSISVGCWGRIYVHFLVDLNRRSGPLIEKMNCDRSALNMCY